ncbi:MAG: DUF58 domain-containing protein [Candidatus Thermoplasmatota archaeon]|nr:DUF58 domain-containing protein [Candidatus Thermoplasmatota archaeon]
MRTRKFAAIIAGCLGIITASLVLVDWTVLLWIAPLIILLFLSVSLYSFEDMNLSLSHQTSHTTVFEDSIVKVTYTLKNSGDQLRFLEVYDELPERVRIVNGSNYALLSLKHNEEMTMSYDVLCPLRGQYTIGPLCVRSRDCLGLFYQEKTMEGSNQLTVVPAVETIRDIEVKGRVNPYPGMMYTRRAGLGTEFHGVRTYVPGDSYKRINWKCSARWTNLMVNEYELESTTDVILILDARQNQQTSGSIQQNPLEYGIKAAVTLAATFLKKRDRVGLIIYGEKDGKLTWVYPESGNTQLFKLTKELVQATAAGSFTVHATINTAIGHMIPNKSLVIFISSLEDDPSIASAIETLQAHNASVLVISPSPVDIEYLLQGTDPDYDLAYRILSLQRQTTLSQVRKTGARIVDWNPAEPLALALKEVQQYRIRR